MFSFAQHHIHVFYYSRILLFTYSIIQVFLYSRLPLSTLTSTSTSTSPSLFKPLHPFLHIFPDIHPEKIDVANMVVFTGKKDIAQKTGFTAP